MKSISFSHHHSTATMKKVLMVEDHSIVMKGFRLIFERECSQYALDTVSSIAEMMKALQRNDYIMAVVDIQLEDGLSINILPDVIKLYPQLNILMFTGYSEEIYAQRLFSMGVKGYLNKHADEVEIGYALHKVLAGKMYCSENFSTSILRKNKVSTNPFNKLSQREMEVALLLLQGKRSSQVCAELNLQPSTVTTYKIKIFTKLEVDNVVDMERLAVLYQVM